MAVTGLREVSTQPFEGGRSWGAGRYSWTRAIADLAVDPAAAANNGITDLSSAPVDAAGNVTWSTDLRLLEPDGGGNGKLLLVIPNRGMLGGLPFAVDAPMEFFLAERPHPGDGFLLADGWTIAWCGWQWDVLPGPISVGCNVPEAGWPRESGAGRPGAAPETLRPMRIEFRPDELQAEHALSDSSLLFRFQDYPAADLQDPEAVLYVRTAPDADLQPLPRDSWHFPDATTVRLTGGFQPFHWYTLVYRTSRNPVTGAGLLAVRDVVSQLRRERGFSTALGYGVSQSGRFLRQFLYEARNLDEQGDPVFDGLFAHIAGGRRGEFNHRYAQPSLTHVLGFSNLPPYDTAGLLAPQRAAGGCPKLLLTNTSWEYWRGDGALVHIDPLTGADLPEDPDCRTYLLRGTDHLGAAPIKGMMPVANPVHDHDVQPILRALFLALDSWVSKGDAPPPSEVPRFADGTAALRSDVLATFAAAATTATTTAMTTRRGFVVPDDAALPVTREIDLGPAAADGIGAWPAVLGHRAPAVVSTVDEDGNERAGVALPVVGRAVAAYTGWNPRRPVEGLPGTIYEFVGSALPLLSGRPVPRREEYEEQARRYAADLMDRRLLLERDLQRTIDEAMRVYDARSS